jgi:hypothetical protein
MPPRKKIDLLPSELKERLNAELLKRGFGDYVALSDDLNTWLEKDGLEVRIGKSALHNYGQEYEAVTKLREEVGNWAKGLMADFDLSEEAEQHRVLFQMMTSVAFKVLKSQMNKDGGEIDPRDLHFLGKMMKDIMSSSGIREKLAEDERQRIRAEEREIAQKKAQQQVEETLEAAVVEDGLSEAVVSTLRKKFLGLRAA